LLPLSATIGWNYPQPLHVAHVVAPAMRNNFVLAVPRAKPATRLTRFVEQLLREMVARHFGVLAVARAGA
jgi:LysR family nitrogen assimilation transcriptional regulator